METRILELGLEPGGLNVKRVRYLLRGRLLLIVTAEHRDKTRQQQAEFIPAQARERTCPGCPPWRLSAGSS